MMNKNIRDYIYLDVTRLRSIYAQLAGGLVENIITSEQTTETASHVETVDDSNVSKDILLGAEKTEKVVLHDYLYTKVEDLLGNNIQVVNSGTELTVVPGDFVRISGKAEINDTQRLLEVFEDFNTFYGGTILATHAHYIEKSVFELEQELARENSKSKRDKIQRDIDAFSPDHVIRSLGKGIPNILKVVLKTWLTLLYKDMFEVKIVADDDDTNSFRAILDRRFLRENPSFLYAKFGSRTQVKWTVVGQITTVMLPTDVSERDMELEVDVENYLYKQDETPIDQFNTETKDKEDSASNVSAELPNSGLRGAIENLFDAIYGIEKHLLVSNDRKTWIITPIAIYTETPRSL